MVVMKMTFRDWVEESVERYRTLPPAKATKQSAWAFWRGGCRKTIDPTIGRPIWERGDWDVLVVLDACRYDQLVEVAPEYPELPNDVDRVWSNASASIDWIERNFNGCPESASRAGYVTANPFADHADPDSRSADLDEDTVGHLRLLYQTEWQDIGNGIETVPPEPMTEHAIDAWRRRVELGIDRLVVHYMQPHEPFRSRPEWGNGDHKLLKNLVSEGAEAGASVYPLLQSGEIDLDEFWEVYQDNLRWVLDDVTDRLLTNVDGEIVLTSDHGNGLGEWGSWHHPPGTIMPAVRRVPWLEVEGVDRGTVRPDLTDSEDVDEATADQLEALGYT